MPKTSARSRGPGPSTMLSARQRAASFTIGRIRRSAAAARARLRRELQDGVDRRIGRLLASVLVAYRSPCRSSRRGGSCPRRSGRSRPERCRRSGKASWRIVPDFRRNVESDLVGEPQRPHRHPPVDQGAIDRLDPVTFVEQPHRLGGVEGEQSVDEESRAIAHDDRRLAQAAGERRRSAHGGLSRSGCRRSPRPAASCRPG